MAYAVRDQRLSPAVRLRQDLSEAERLLPQLNGGTVESFLLTLDRIAQQFEQLADSGLDLRPEESRMESIESRLQRRPGEVANAAARLGGLKRLREQNPPAEHYWWHLDKLANQQRRALIRRLATTVGSVLLVLGLLYGGMRIFFPPDPDVLILTSATAELPDLAAMGEWDEALAVIDSAAAQMSRPEPELLVWRGVILQAMGQPEQAEAALAQAQEFIDPSQNLAYWLLLGNAYLAANQIPLAEDAAASAQILDPDAPQIYFLLGNIAEIQGNRRQAIEHYETVFELSMQSDPQLAVISRVRIGNLLQQVDIAPGSDPENAPDEGEEIDQ